MRWEDREGSENVEDRRGRRMGGGGLGRRGAGGIVLFLAVIVAGYYGIDLSPLLNDGGGVMVGPAESTPYTPSAEENKMARFTSVALKTTEDTWDAYFRSIGKTYVPPRLVMYTGATETGCGYGQAASGPFYCPEDQTIYLDLSFYRDLETKMGGGGDFAQGYVLAHEVGHHVQHLLGIEQQVQRLRGNASERGSNQLSVKLELQADCFAGVWGNAMKKQGILDPGDLEEALNTAAAIGDDRLQRQSMGRVVPDSFTHGTSQQRYYWFKRGFDSGDPRMCNTFADSQ